jgi:molybdopterin-guanine dinucleotide biosynthesis protein A
MDFQHITGIILAGGRSSRFGEDKALYHYNGKAMVEYAIDALFPICEQLLLVTNRPNDYYGLTGVTFIRDIYLGCGPLGGIHAGLLASGNNDNLIAGCDMPGLKTDLFRTLLLHNSDAQVVIPTHNGFKESLACYYHKSALLIIEEALKQSRFKIFEAIKPLRIQYLNVEEMVFYSEGLFANVNTREDINHI